MNYLYRALCVIAFVLTLLWGVGIICTDRWFWSQWLAWIPTVVMLGVLFLVAVVSFIANRKLMAVLFAGVSTLLFIRYVFFENALLHNSHSPHGLNIVGWTMSHPDKRGTAAESAEEIIRLNGDITLLTHGWFVRGEHSLKEWLGPGGRRVINGPFTVLTKLPVVEVRTLVASDAIYISSFTFDANKGFEKPLVLWAIDLPSDLLIPRAETAKRVTRLLAQLDSSPPDIVMGDFNMTRNSFAIKSMFPMLVDASDTGGNGLLSTFPLDVPLYHIDHTLLDQKLVCHDYSIINPHIGRHRIQKCVVAPEANE